MSLADLIVTALKASIFLTVFAFGLRTVPDDVLSLVRRPGLLVRSLGTMFLLMPLLALAAALTFEFHPAVEIALVALAVSPVPPLLPRRGIKAGGRSSYAFGLLLVAAVLSIGYIPLVVGLIARFQGLPLRIRTGDFVGIVLLSVIVPFVLGMGVHRFAPQWAGKMARPIGITAIVLLVAGILPVLVKLLPPAVSLVGNGAVLLFALFIIVGLVAGHLIGGPDPDDRGVLALFTSSRHPAVAMTIGMAAYPDQPLVPAAVFLYLVLSALLALPYVRWKRSRHVEVNA